MARPKKNHIHKYTDISREARTWGRTSTRPQISKPDMQIYLESANIKFVELGTLLRIADAIESLRDEVHASRMCMKIDEMRARLDAVVELMKSR